MTQVIEVCNAVDTGCRQVIRKVRHAREAMRIEVVIGRDISMGREVREMEERKRQMSNRKGRRGVDVEENKELGHLQNQNLRQIPPKFAHTRNEKQEKGDK